ncbi:MAG: serine/threonine protein phosphatase [Sphingomonas sp.]|uniref:metallophosphoesterase family protein n=1 Tax=Sphingomonas sp. TaxID=28214 RepID=UPI001AC2B1B5|nr:metallophosphoesterase family protein [Sphingomonas sp.]MBN8808418.1 serine/threonine protein phosphatase [Sphingomonas sp.]
MPNDRKWGVERNGSYQLRCALRQERDSLSVDSPNLQPLPHLLIPVNVFTRSSPPTRPSIPKGHRVYAIGDIHGEAGLLRELLKAIEEDSGAQFDAFITLILLGDIIDRGNDAAALVATFAHLKLAQVIVIRGNHEDALAQAYRGNDEVLDAWMPFGAITTLKGFGITLREVDATNAVFSNALRSRIDSNLIEWIEGLPTSWECGDYYFTHAGIRPGVELKDQDDADLLWIREPFLSSKRNHGKVIVHGHTVEVGVPTLGSNRIGIDTGAHEHGVLTALGLEGDRQWLLQAVAADRHPASADEERLAEVELALGNCQPLPDIAALITAIVTPRPLAPDAPLLLTAGRRLLDRQPVPRRLGTGGYVAAGFALVLALVGGGMAYRSGSWRKGSGDIAISMPDTWVGKKPPKFTAAPSQLSVETPGPRINDGNRSRRQSAPRSRYVTRQSTHDRETSPRLYGNALERALEDDRIATRRLNAGELSRHEGKPVD